MSNFLKQGKRQSENYKKVLVKKHTKEFYRTLGRLDKVADQLKELDIDITEDNIETEAAKIIGRDIDNFEKLILLGKLSKYEDNIK